MFKILSLVYAELQRLTWHEYALLSIVMLWFLLNTFYTLYLAAINVWDNRSNVSKWVLGLAAPTLAAMVVIDVVMNWTLFTLFMFDLPREAFVTTRLKRYQAQVSEDWRKRFAVVMCTKLLNPFDPNKHHC
jgi:hypothetical protein